MLINPLLLNPLLSMADLVWQKIYSMDYSNVRLPIDWREAVNGNWTRPENPYPTSVGEKPINSLQCTYVWVSPIEAARHLIAAAQYIPTLPLTFPVTRSSPLNVFQESRAKTFTEATGFLSTPSRITLLLSSRPPARTLSKSPFPPQPPHPPQQTGAGIESDLWGATEQAQLIAPLLFCMEACTLWAAPNMGNNERETGSCLGCLEESGDPHHLQVVLAEWIMAGMTLCTLP